MRIAEIYRSRQGEGLLTGTASVFVRAAGCNLRCWFCDTPFASWHPEGEDLAVEEIVEQAVALAVDHVVLTGGEPMLFAELIPLCNELARLGKHITIETAGTLYLPVQCTLMSISPKLANSTPTVAAAGRWSARHERTRANRHSVQQLIAEHDYQLKFVVDQPADCQQVESYLSGLTGVRGDRVLLMPQGRSQPELESKAEWLAEYCEQHSFRFCPRKQIEWFGLTRGT